MKDQATSILDRILRLADLHISEIKLKADRIDTKTGALTGFSPTDARVMQDYAKICIMAMKEELKETTENLSDEELIQKAAEILKRTSNESMGIT